jgi:hypothetical protein
MSSSRMTWRRPSAARRPLIGSACPDGRRGGGGVRSATLRTITRRSTAAAGVRPRSRSSARAQGRARVSSGAGVGSGQWRRRLINGAAAQRPAARSSHCSDSSIPTAMRWRAWLVVLPPSRSPRPLCPDCGFSRKAESRRHDARPRQSSRMTCMVASPARSTST